MLIVGISDFSTLNEECHGKNLYIFLFMYYKHAWFMGLSAFVIITHLYSFYNNNNIIQTQVRDLFTKSYSNTNRCALYSVTS